MNWINGLQRAIDYVEAHLNEELDYGEIAKQAYSSSFHFQRIFSILCGCTLGEYIRNRRLSQAGSELAAADCRVIDTALKYGYDSPESFCRAFTKFHGINPSEAKTRSSCLKSFSRLSVKLVLEGGTTMDYRIEKKDAFQVIAKRARYQGGGEITQKTIHDTWAACREDGTIEALCRYVKPDGMFGNAIVGICFDNPDKGAFDYGIGAAYTGGEAAKGLTVEEVPASTWAVFSGTGGMPEAFRQLWKRIYSEFFPTSSYQPAGGMCIEVYSSDEVYKEDFHFEIWLSVDKK
ncbi:AraC family transcriptional regulator [Lachnospiraceae bacterium 54-53]